MTCLIVASLLLIAIVLVQETQCHTSMQVSGTCASIGFSTTCCPPDHDGQCEASDGDCFCGSDCHIFGDCCADVHCPANPRTCRDVGITSCCSDPTGSGFCTVHYRPPDPPGQCSCNVTCHQRDDCCSDAESFCVPRTCTEAGKNNGCCVWSSVNSCFVPGGRCYCDSYCTHYNDCCSDVPPAVNYQYCQSVGTLQFAGRSRVQSDLEQDLKASTLLRNGNNRRSRIQNTRTRYAYRDPHTARAQRPRVNARDNRVKAYNQRGH